MLPRQLTTAKTKSRKPMLPPRGGPRLQPRPGGGDGGVGVLASLSSSPDLSSNSIPSPQHVWESGSLGTSVT